MNEKVLKLKKDLVRFGKMINDRNLVIGPGGNISVRLDDIIYITPSGYGFDEINEEDIIGINITT